MVGTENDMKKALESLYIGSATVFNTQFVKNPVTKIQEEKEVIIYENIPCRISFERLVSAINNYDYSKAELSIKLFIDPNIKIEEGSKIMITQNNQTSTYKRSGIPAVFSTHQEIILVRIEDYI